MLNPLKILPSRVALILALFLCVIIVSLIKDPNANPKYANAYFVLGEEDFQKGRLDKAAKYFERTIQLNPQLAIGYEGLGRIYAQRNDDFHAIDLFEKAVRLDPNFHQAFNNLGLVYQRLGQYDQALKNFDRALHVPGNTVFIPTYRYNLAVTCALMGDKAGAMQEIEYIEKYADPAVAQKLRRYLESNPTTLQNL